MSHVLNMHTHAVGTDRFCACHPVPKINENYCTPLENNSTYYYIIS